MSTVAEKCKRRSYESRLRKSNKENDFNYNVSKPFKNQDKNDYIFMNSIGKFISGDIKYFNNENKNDQKQI